MVTNAGLEHFVEEEPSQYVKLTMAVVQDFRFTWSSSNPMVHYKIYNIAVDLPFADFWRDCSLVCASSACPIRFLIGRLYLEYFAAIGVRLCELVCLFYA